ncbi:MAG: GntR family transcriptional regulator [Candidatus Abyssobacteria bacterium SURF_5]|uniref:GntR family transcriptional regulator n=1 Tax=Abyssobacteria bacterium (strain SURF_5) TaxID=2093360 RepID=A0A3A4NGB0_ABYX5|nr:MAG: GntR family transcriptional regulator [Candidatus Abyssubacteria bacterium SURF_5]
MIIHIDPADGLPIYLQIANEVRHSIAVGALRPGEQLPSVREVAEQITVNPNTVAKAYRELELQGILETRRGTGTFVSQQAVKISRKEKDQILIKLIDRLLDEARHLQVSEEELLRLVTERIEVFEQARKREDIRIV